MAAVCPWSEPRIRPHDQQHDQCNEVGRDDHGALLYVSLPPFRPPGRGVPLVPGFDDAGACERNQAGAGDRDDLGEDLRRREAHENAHDAAVGVIHVVHAFRSGISWLSIRVI